MKIVSKKTLPKEEKIVFIRINIICCTIKIHNFQIVFLNNSNLAFRFLYAKAQICYFFSTFLSLKIL